MVASSPSNSTSYRHATSAPRTRPLLPRTSSGTSGFFFCGMIELPDNAFISTDMTQLAYTGNYAFNSLAPRSWPYVWTARSCTRPDRGL